jgi:hypothetical protein
VTIVVASAAPDGMVLASDSRTTLLGATRHRVASDHARKVFELPGGVGLATYGAAVIGDRTVAGAVEEFVAAHGGDKPANEASEAIATFFDEYLREAAREIRRDPPPGALGLMVAGYDADGVGRIRDVLLPIADARNKVHDSGVGTREPGVTYRGRTRYVRRMVEGYDRDGLDAADASVPSSVEHELGRLGYIVSPPRSPQDALDLAAFIVRMTIDMERLTDGTYANKGDVPACGGQIQALLVTRESSRWIAEPQLTIRPAGRAEDG